MAQAVSEFMGLFPDEYFVILLYNSLHAHPHDHVTWYTAVIHTTENLIKYELLKFLGLYIVSKTNLKLMT